MTVEIYTPEVDHDHDHDHDYFQKEIRAAKAHQADLLPGNLWTTIGETDIDVAGKMTVEIYTEAVDHGHFQKEIRAAKALQADLLPGNLQIYAGDTDIGVGRNINHIVTEVPVDLLPANLKTIVIE